MYDFESLEQDEKIINIEKNIFIETNNNPKQVDFVLTNKRLLLFSDSNKEVFYMEALTARGSNFIPDNKLVFFSILDDIEIINHQKNSNEYIFKDKNKFISTDKITYKLINELKEDK